MAKYEPNCRQQEGLPVMDVEFLFKWVAPFALAILSPFIVARIVGFRSTSLNLTRDVPFRPSGELGDATIVAGRSVATACLLASVVIVAAFVLVPLAFLDDPHVGGAAAFWAMFLSPVPICLIIFAARRRYVTINSFELRYRTILRIVAAVRTPDVIRVVFRQTGKGDTRLECDVVTRSEEVRLVLDSRAALRALASVVPPERRSIVTPIELPKL